MDHDIYFAVYAKVVDGKTTFFAIDSEALIGSYDGHVWDNEAQEWGRDEPINDAYALLAEALDRINQKGN